MTTQREDGRGHWPAGRRRNDGAPPKGWDTIDEFLADVNRYVRATRQMSALADVLEVNRRCVERWLDGSKYPEQARRTQIARWYRREIKKNS